MHSLQLLAQCTRSGWRAPGRGVMGGCYRAAAQDLTAVKGPFQREMVQRLPAFLRPRPVLYGHVLAVDAQGKVVADLQDPSGAYPINTSVTETADYLYIGSLVASTG